MNPIKPYLELSRISNLPTVWTNVLAAIVLSGTEFSLSVFLPLAASMSLFYSGGMCLNDIMDANSDRVDKPFRPVPSGKISIKNAYILTGALFIIALSLLFLVPYQKALYAGFLLLSVIIVYNKFHKAHPSSVILMATCRLMVFVVSAIAVTGKVGLFVAMAGLLQFIYTLAISMTARYENKSGKLFSFSIIPFMIASISLLDGIVLAVFVLHAWIIAGIAGTILTFFGQKYIRGD